MAKVSICSVDGCDKNAKSKGWCVNHYRRWKTHGDPLAGRITPNKTQKVCSIEGCNSRTKGRGWCNAHYTRWQRHGDPVGGTASPGAPASFLLDVAIPYTGSDCLIWPFGKDRRGYGHIDLQKRPRTKLAHRIVCIAAHGAPPNPKYEAAHNCGNASCVNPQHLRWATPIENQADRLIHGTSNRGERCATSKLTPAKVRDIRKMCQNRTQTYVAIGEKFGVTESSIRLIACRKNWAWLE